MTPLGISLATRITQSRCVEWAGRGSCVARQRSQRALSGGGASPAAPADQTCDGPDSSASSQALTHARRSLPVCPMHRALYPFFKKVADKYADICGYRQHGLKYDDLIIEENETVQTVSDELSQVPCWGVWGWKSVLAARLHLHG